MFVARRNVAGEGELQSIGSHKAYRYPEDGKHRQEGPSNSDNVNPQNIGHTLFGTRFDNVLGIEEIQGSWQKWFQNVRAMRREKAA